MEIAYIRGSQISFIVLPDMLSRAPFFNRIKLWRKFKGHAVYGANTAAVNAGIGPGGRGFGGRGPGGPRGGGRGGPPDAGRGSIYGFAPQPYRPSY